MLNDKIYVCHVEGYDPNSKVEKVTYSCPHIYRCPISPVDGATEIAAFGERVHKMFKASMNTVVSKRFKENDLVYYEKEPPTIELVSEDEEGNVITSTDFDVPYGKKANYKVVSVRPQNVKRIIYFEKLP